ncbi:hypothetical protein GGQ85_003925 [Nitrobacter vulgaris]|nr:hypothetical protein [Nitrobacter vulgaris]
MDNLFHALAMVGGPLGQGLIDSSAVKTKKTLGKTMQELTDEVSRESLGRRKMGGGSIRYASPGWNDITWCVRDCLFCPRAGLLTNSWRLRRCRRQP